MAKLVNHALREEQRLKEKRQRMNRKIGIAVAICGCLSLLVFASTRPGVTPADGSLTSSFLDVSSTNQEQEGSNENGKTVNVEELSIDMSLTYYADIDIEDYGKITVKLDQSAAPVTVDNFVSLAESGFYDGLTFHRIMEGFMMQGGDPKGNGTGGADKKIVGEFMANGYNNTLSHTRGAISMARANPYDSASSQFFIVHQDCGDSLDGMYAVFGYVTEGMDVVDEVCTDAKPVDNNGTIPAANQPVIKSITIRTEK